MTLVRRGIPEQYGIFYAMGGALSMEGILSACYHICPTKVNFQFDTTFMYVISVLVFLKEYQVSEERMAKRQRVSSEQRPGNFQASVMVLTRLERSVPVNLGQFPGLSRPRPRWAGN